MMSEKAYEVLNKIHQVYGKIYGFEWYYYLLVGFWVISFLVSFIGLYNSMISLIISLILIIINIVVFVVIFCLTRRKMKFISKSRKDKNLIKIMEKELKKINISSIDQLNLIITEIDEVENIQKEKNTKVNSIISKVFFFIFWIPLSFFASYYINNSGEILIFSEIRTLLISLLLISIQIIIISLFVNLILNEVLAIADIERRKRSIARRYINDIKYLKLNNHL